MNVLRVSVVSVGGILIGAAITAAIFGGTMYSIPNLGHFGTGPMAWMYAAIVGAFCGAAWGFVLGFVVGASKCGKGVGGWIGGGMCIVISGYVLLSYLLSFGAMWRPTTIIVLLMLIPLGTLTGLALAAITASGIWHRI